MEARGLAWYSCLTTFQTMSDRQLVSAKAQLIGDKLGGGQHWTLLFPEGDPWEPLAGATGVPTNGFVTDTNGVDLCLCVPVELIVWCARGTRCQRATWLRFCLDCVFGHYSTHPSPSVNDE